MKNLPINQYRDSVDRIDSAFLYLLSEYAALPKFQSTIENTKTEPENFAEVHPALLNLIDALKQEILPFRSYHAENEGLIGSSIEVFKAASLEKYLTQLLIYRFKVITQIGVLKHLNKIAVQDSQRWRDLCAKRLEMAKNLQLPVEKVESYLAKLHKASCIWQELIAKLMSEGENFAEFQKDN